MVTIKINDKSKSGKAVLETIKLISKEDKNVTIIDDTDDDLIQKMEEKDRKSFLNEKEKKQFLTKFVCLFTPLLALPKLLPKQTLQLLHSHE